MNSKTTKAEKLSLESKGLEPAVDAEKTIKPRALFSMWASVNISMFGAGIAALCLSYHVSVLQAVVIALLGCVFAAFLYGSSSILGKETGVPALVLTRADFGYKGARVFSLISWLYVVGWEIILFSTIPVAIIKILENVYGIRSNAVTLAIILVLGVTIILITRFGMRLITKIQKYLTALGFIQIIFLLIFAIPKIDFSKIQQIPSGNPVSVLGVFVLIFSSIGIGWITVSPNYTRYLKKDTSSGRIIFTTILGTITPLVLILSFGFMVFASNPDYISGGIVDPIGTLIYFIPIWFVPFYLVSQALLLSSGVIMDIYSSCLSFISMGVNAKRTLIVITDGVLMMLGTIYICFFSNGLLNVMNNFAIIAGNIIAAQAGIFLAGLFIHRNKYDIDALYKPGSRYKDFQLSSFVIFAIASIVGLGFTITDFTSPCIGFFSNLFAGINPEFASMNIGVLLAFVISFSLRLFCVKVCKLNLLYDVEK